MWRKGHLCVLEYPGHGDNGARKQVKDGLAATIKIELTDIFIRRTVPGRVPPDQEGAQERQAVDVLQPQVPLDHQRRHLPAPVPASLGLRRGLLRRGRDGCSSFFFSRFFLVFVVAVVLGGAVCLLMRLLVPLVLLPLL